MLKIRNPVIARIFRELKLIEQWGSGVRNILREAQEQNLPEPIFEEIGTRLRLSVLLAEKNKETTELKRFIHRLRRWAQIKKRKRRCPFTSGRENLLFLFQVVIICVNRFNLEMANHFYIRSSSIFFITKASGWIRFLQTSNIASAFRSK